MAGILPESATERLLREMREQGRLFDEINGTGALHKHRSLIAELIEKDPLFKEISDTGGLRRHRSPVDELIERNRNSSLSAIEQHARRDMSGITEAARTITQGLGTLSGTASVPARPRKLEAARGGAIRSVADLGPLIRTARKAMKLNQAQFAAHAGVGRRFLSELEGGKPSLEFDKVLACAAAAGIDFFARARRG